MMAPIGNGGFLLWRQDKLFASLRKAKRGPRELGLDYQKTGTPEYKMTFLPVDVSGPVKVLALYPYSDLRSLMVIDGQGYALVDNTVAGGLLERCELLLAGESIPDLR